MPYIPLKLPSGVHSNGTLYQAKGRWYSANLVRWQEGAMQPVGGWTRLYRNDAPDLSAGISDDGGVMTDQTTAINNATTGDVTLSPAVPAINDAYYFGMAFPFAGVSVYISTAGVGGTVVWEYYNGSTWVDLSTSHNLVDNTVGFTATAGSAYTAAWDVPTDWATTTVNSQGPFYYVRARFTANGTSGATGDYADMYLSPIYLDPISSAVEDEVARGAIGWKNISDTPWLGFGTPRFLYVYAGAILYDVTPVGFTTGKANAEYASGDYGDGSYGAGPFGTGDTASSTLTEAQTWQLDTFGEDLVACAYSDGKIYRWDLSVGGGTPAAAITDSVAADPPLSNVGVVVTPERFCVALGADGDARYIRWSDQEDIGAWTASASNASGDFTLPGSGSIQCGLRQRNETLIWTDVDLFAMRYIGGTLVYTFPQVGNGCGIIGKLAKAAAQGMVFWMGHRGFYMYDGAVRQIPCEISDTIFNDINRDQRSKIVAIAVSEYHEVWFCYPSAGSTENDSIVAYNYAENHWSGPWTLERLSGFDRGPFAAPVMFDARGQIYLHENGTEMYTPSRTSQYTPTAASGPIEIGAGDNVLTINRVIPDEESLGDVDMTLYAALYPTATESSQAITTLTEPTSCRLTGRQVRLAISQDQPSWRLGEVRLEVVRRGRR